MNEVLTNFGLLFLRAAFALTMLICHGVPKLQMIIDGKSSTFLNPLGIGAGLSLWLAVLAEVGCAALITLGIFTRFAAAILVINMLVAMKWCYDQNASMELAFLYFLVFATLIITGAGGYSFDRLIGINF